MQSGPTAVRKEELFIMCVFSIEAKDTRRARAGELLVTHRFTHATGFTSPASPGVALCVLPGSTLRFEQPIVYHHRGIFASFLRLERYKLKVTEFTSAKLIEVPKIDGHTDALELPNGIELLLNDLAAGQRARVESIIIKTVMEDAINIAKASSAGTTVLPPRELARP